MTPLRSRALPDMLGGLALALTLAALLLRTLTTGAGLELNSPGTQLLLDGVALTGATFLALARALRGEAALGVSAAVVAALGIWTAALVASAAGAPHPDLAWRTVTSAFSLLVLGMTVGDLSRDDRLRPIVLGFLLASVVTAVSLGLWWYAVEQPRLEAAFDQSQSELGQQLELYDASFRQGLRERAFDRVAAGPFVIGNLLACAVATLLPLALVLTWGGFRGPWPAAGWLGAVLSLVLVLGLCLSGSKGGVLALGAGLGTFTVLHPRLVAWRRRLALSALALGATAGLILGGLYVSDPEARGVGMSVQVRLEYWQAGLGMFGDAPLLGHGPNQYRELVSAYKSARAEEAIHAHNAEVQLLAETGLLGLGALVALLLLWLRPAWRQLMATEATGTDPPERPLVPRAQIHWWSLLGFVLGGLLLTGHGDYVSGAPDTQGQLAYVLLAVPAFTVVFTLLVPSASPRLLPAAGWAGLAAFAVAAQFDFVVHHAGTLLVAAGVAGALPWLAPGISPPRQPRWVTAVVAGGLSLLTATLVLGLAPGGLRADALRYEARNLHLEGALLAQSEEPSDRTQALARLRDASRAFQESLVEYPWSSFTWRERSATLEGLGEDAEALSCLREAVAANPRAHSSWHALATLLDRLGRHEEARAPHQKALALYPYHPGMLLAAGASSLELSRRTPAGPERDALVAEARDLVERALRASAETRLVLRKLSPEQEAQAQHLLSLTPPPR